ncbi:MAG: hypothetical protein ACU0E9_07760 [Limimaricola soesokkakensis]|uniref:hypothetical protein n=1 Tax=Limimaricola soesokkakensis TaxID=1343159 RepID=UPI004057EBB7
MATDFEKLNIILAARDREFARAMERNTRRVERFTRDSNRNLSRTSQKFDGLATAAKGFAAALAAGGLATGLSRMRQTTAAIATIGDEARRAGVSVQAFQELKFVGDQNRVGIDALVDGLKELNLRADEFIVTGKGSAAEAFERLGYDAESLARGLEDPSDLMLEIIGRLGRLDQAAQIRIADEVFGGTGGEQFVQLISQGEDKLRQTVDRAHEVGAVLGDDVVTRAAEVDAKFAEIETRVGHIGKLLAVEAVDGLTELLNGAADLNLAFETMERLRRSVGTAAEDLDGMGDLGAEGMRDLAAEAEASEIALGNAAGQAAALAQGLRSVAVDVGNTGSLDEALELDRIGARLADLVGAWERNEIGAAEFQARANAAATEAQGVIDRLGELDGANLSGVIGQVGGLIGALAAAARQAVATRTAVADAVRPPSQDRIAAQERRLDPGDPAPPPEPEPEFEGPRPAPRPHVVDIGTWGDNGSGGGGGGGGGSADRQTDWQRELERTKEDIAALAIEAQELAAVAQAGRTVGDAMDYARKRAELLTAAQEAGREITPELRAEIDTLAASYAENAQAADTAAEGLRAMEDRAKDLQRTAETMGDAMSGMFASIVKGSQSGQDALSGLLSKFADMAANAAFSGMFGGMFAPISAIFTPRAGATPSFAGGGDTGWGARAGGIDGQGGFPAILHPKETVIDHTKGPRGGAGGGGVALTFAPQIDARGADPAAIERLEKAQRKMASEFEARTVRAVKDAKTRRIL